MIPNLFHYIFFDLGKGKKFEDFPIFINTLKKCKEINNNFNIKVWNEKEIDEIIKKYDFYGIYKNFKYPVQRVDFAKYLILYELGGIYTDLDLEPLKDCTPLLNNSVIFSKSPYEPIQNNCIGTEKGNPLFFNLMKYSIKQYEEKILNKIYETWKGRFVLQTTGPRMMTRFLKQYKDLPSLDITSVPEKEYTAKNPYFKDYCTKTWMEKIFYGDNIKKNSEQFKELS